MSLITPDFGLIVWMTLIFGIVFFILAKFGFPIITGMVDKRNTYISESLQKADEANRCLSEIAQEQARILDQARAEKAAILKEASQMKDEIMSQAQIQARDEAAKILQKARVDIADMKQEALGEARREIAMLSLNIAERVLHGKLDTDGQSQNELIDRLVDDSGWNTDIKN